MYCQLRDVQLGGKEERFPASSLLSSLRRPRKAEVRFACRANENILDCSYLRRVLMTAAGQGTPAELWPVNSSSFLEFSSSMRLENQLCDRFQEA